MDLLICIFVFVAGGVMGVFTMALLFMAREDDADEHEESDGT